MAERCSIVKHYISLGSTLFAIKDKYCLQRKKNKFYTAIYSQVSMVHCVILRSIRF